MSGVTITETAKDYLKSVSNGDYVTLGSNMYGILKRTGQM